MRFCLCALSLLWAIELSARTPPVDRKFVAYGGPMLALDTELRGRVVAIEGSDLYIEPFPNYEHLLIEGNRRSPGPNDSCGEETNRQARCGYTWYVLNIGTAPPPRGVIKLETYSVGMRASHGQTHPVTVRDGVETPVSVGQNVRVQGLYVVDYAHPMYFPLPTSAWCYGRGIFQSCFAHAELHPYRLTEMELLRDVVSSSERHTVVAPMTAEWYPNTWFANRIFGLGNTLRDVSMETTQRARFYLRAPARPSGAPHVLRVHRGDEKRFGKGVVEISEEVDASGDGVWVTVVAKGSDPDDPLIHSAQYTATWQPAPLSAEAVSVVVPETMFAGAPYWVEIAMRNTSGVVWPRSAGIRLGSSAPTWGVQRVDLPADIRDGLQGVFRFAVRAPATAGTYDFQWQMVRNDMEWFGEKTPLRRVSVVIAQVADDAEVDVQPIMPREITRGTTATAVVAFRNRGRSIWIPHTYALRESDGTLVPLPQEQVLPNEIVRFEIPIQPSASRFYRWRMVRLGVPFGDETWSIHIFVHNP